MEIKIRVRREYSFTSTGLSPIAELPPHARRIHQESDWQEARLGTTSVCAENTAAFGSAKIPPRNYLRVRGEYFTNTTPVAISTELPPRARRIPPWCWVRPEPHGTTSACAENTCCQSEHICQPRNYLRMRGEYCRLPHVMSLIVELPPHARRILENLLGFGVVHGTTSACAENTGHPTIRGAHRWNYLRVRGEYETGVRFIYSGMELPPRARRIL